MTLERQAGPLPGKFPERQRHLDNFVGSRNAANAKIEVWQDLLDSTEMEEQKRQAIAESIELFKQKIQALKSGQIIQYCVEDLQDDLKRLDTNRLEDSDVIHNLIKQIESDAQELITKDYRY